MFISFSCRKERSYRYELTGNALGTFYQVVYTSPKDIKNLSFELDSIFDAFNASLSTYHKTSLISRINKGEKVKVDSLFTRVFARSLAISKQTDGLFDPTVGILINAWGFGPDGVIAIDTVHLEKKRLYVGIEKTKLLADGTLQKHDSTQFDFNAIAKGYAVDVVGDHIKNKHNIQNYMVNIGGEILAKGINQEGRFWQIGIEKPLENSDKEIVLQRLTLKNKGMATSGNYRKFYKDAKGRKYAHTVSPKTGCPVQSNLLSATVLCKDVMTADAYATVFMVMGLETTKAFLKKKNKDELSVFLIYFDETTNALKTWHTEDFPLG